MIPFTTASKIPRNKSIKEEKDTYNRKFTALKREVREVTQNEKMSHAHTEKLISRKWL